MSAADIERLETIKNKSYGGPMTTYIDEGSLLQRIPKFLPPSVGSFSWAVSLLPHSTFSTLSWLTISLIQEVANILASPISTEPVNISNDIREQIHTHARAHLYNYKGADSMPHGPDRTWMRIAHHVVTCLWAWEQGKYGDSACLKPGEIFRIYNGYLRQCALFQWARDIALEAERTNAPTEELRAAGARAFDLIERAKNTWEVESATVQQPDYWLTFKLSEFQLHMNHLRNLGQ